jgi:hypothetical protein
MCYSKGPEAQPFSAECIQCMTTCCMPVAGWPHRKGSFNYNHQTLYRLTGWGYTACPPRGVRSQFKMYIRRTDSATH